MRTSMIYLFFIFFNLFSYGDKKERIKLYVIFTPSHEKLFEQWFLPSLSDDYDLIIKRIPQECPTAIFRKQGWTKTTLRKVNFIIEAIQSNWDRIIIYSDVDIQFFGKTKHVILSAIHDIDMVIQRDNPAGMLCSGFFACRCNQRTLNLWQRVREVMIKNEKISDQRALNIVIKESESSNIRWDYLGKNFLSGGTLSGKQWVPGDILEIPENILLHHANWTKGIKNKALQLQYVRSIVNTRLK